MSHAKLSFLTVAMAYLFPGIREYPRGSFLVEPQELASSQSEDAPQNQAFDLEVKTAVNSLFFRQCTLE